MDVSYLLVDGNTGRDIGSGDCLHLDQHDAKVWHLRNAVKRACARLVLCDAYEMTVSCDGKVLHHHTPLEPLAHKVFRVHLPLVNSVAPPVVPVAGSSATVTMPPVARKTPPVVTQSSISTAAKTTPPGIKETPVVSTHTSTSTLEEQKTDKSKRKRSHSAIGDAPARTAATTTSTSAEKMRKISRSDKRNPVDASGSDSCRYRCTVRGCGKDFARERSLHNHMKKLHRNAQATRDLKQKEQELVDRIKNGQLREPRKSSTRHPSTSDKTHAGVTSRSRHPSKLPAGSCDSRKSSSTQQHQVSPLANHSSDVAAGPADQHPPDSPDRKPTNLAPHLASDARTHPHGRRSPLLGRAPTVITINDSVPMRDNHHAEQHQRGHYGVHARAPGTAAVVHHTGREHRSHIRAAPTARAAATCSVASNGTDWRMSMNASSGLSNAVLPPSSTRGGASATSGNRDRHRSNTSGSPGIVSVTSGSRGRGPTHASRGRSTGVTLNGASREPHVTGRVAGNTIAGGVKVTGKFLYSLNRKQKHPRPKMQDCKTGGHDPKVQLAAAKYHRQMQPYANNVPLTRLQMLAKVPWLPMTAAEIIALYIAHCSVGENMGQGRLFIITEQTFNLVNEIQQYGWEQGLYLSQNIGDDFFVHRINGVEQTLHMVDQVALRVLRATSNDESQADSNEVFRCFCDHFKAWLESMSTGCQG